MKIRWTGLCLPALLIAAAALRFVQLDLVSITADEGIHGLEAEHLSRLQTVVLFGPPSVGIHNTPLFIYTLTVPFFFVREPLAGVAFIAAFQLAALALAWHWGVKWFGRTAAVVACVPLAASAWMVLYARNMWPPSATMPLGIALVGLGCDWLRQGGRWRAFGMAALAFMLPAMHFSGFVAPVWTVGMFAAGRRRFAGPGDVFAVLAGVAVGLLPWLPWLYFQHFLGHWIDLTALRANAAGKQEFSAQTLFDYGQGLLHAGGLRYWFDAAWADIVARRPWGTEPLRLAGAGLMLAGFAAAVWQARHADPLRRALWAWTLLPPLLLLALRPALHPHYLLIAFPVPFLLIGAAVARFARTGPRRLALVVALGIVVAGHLLTLESFRRVLDADLLRSGNRYQLTYRQRRAAAVSAVADAGTSSIEVAGTFSGQQPSYAWLHFVERLRPSKIRRVADPQRLHWFDEADYDELSADERAVLRDWHPRFGRPVVERLWRVGPVRILRLRGEQSAPR